MRRPTLALALAAAGAVALAGLLVAPRPAASQAVDVFLNVIGGGAKKLNIVIPEFTLVAGRDTQGLVKKIPDMTGADLTFSALFSVVTGAPSIPADDRQALKQMLAESAAAGAHAALHGLLTLKGDRAEAEMRLYELIGPEQRLVASKRFDLPAADGRRLAHKIADEVVYVFTGEPGIADTKIAYASGNSRTKELFVMDYDGAGRVRLTGNESINLSPAWSPDARSLAFTSYMRGYPYLYRLFAFDVATGTPRRLTRHPAIDTEPTWSPTGREIAFVSDRAGTAQIFAMDAEGANVRQLTTSAFNTQPRWSPKGDTIAYTARHGGHDIWAINPDGSNPRRLTAGPGSNESASWAPNGRHLVFQSSRLGGWQLFTMLADGSEQQPLTRGGGEFTSPAWSPRLP
jgi:TolB protein